MKLFNLLFLFNFVERITIPPAVCNILPPWSKSTQGKKEQNKENLPRTVTTQTEVLNRRHCGQSQQSAVLKKKTRQATSKIMGLERKKLAKPKKSKKRA